MKIALLEDDMEQARQVLRFLEEEGHEVDHFVSGQSCAFAVTHESYELLILDWQVPDFSGIEVIKTVRKQVNWPIPVLFLTQRDSESDIITALNAGADDYLVKPPRLGELKARIQALARRANPPEDALNESLNFGPFVIDVHARTITKGSEIIPITEKDFELALFMFQNIGRLLSRDFLLERVWGVSSDLNTRTVDTHVSRLRRRLGIKPENGFRIKTIYQHGYRLETIN
ncbi:MAG: response regulator transcription factor [Hahellaceae bacterium]|nr:response regulator transcription factor [Hahellaceae bacterium]